MTSTHFEARRLIARGLFSDLTTFAEFEARLKVIANTKEVGDAFEILVEAYLHTQPKMQAANVWLVGQVPLRIRKQLNLPSDSKGIDGIFETRIGELVPYQVKYRTERDVLPYGEVSAFLGITERSCKDRVIFTNARGLSKDVENRDGLRSVRASHFHALTVKDFASIEAWLTEKPIRLEKRQPRPYQQEAVQKLSEALRGRSRATAVMACGTGKTLVALWVTEALEPKTVLVLVPSLALLSQTLPDWCRESKWDASLEYLCVCSDSTVSKGVDAYTIRSQDADFPITTDASEVRRFLDRKTEGVKIVFSTYQSAPVVAEGMKGLLPFEFGVFDEAHKTTGQKAGLFSFGLTDKNLPIEKRLFLTATPRHYDIRKRDKEGDFRLVSMDDESVYGPVAYRLSFASAVKQGIICPYKIVISVTTKEEVNAELLKHGITLVKRDKIQAQWVATQLALKRAIQKTKASKVITFHSRVALAEEFSSDRSSGIRQHLKGFEVSHVNGGQSAADRESLLKDFKTSANGLITNARCLTEGVDVPSVDMVAFIDPRKSKVDIAQATGRAMRQSKATGKTTGYIVVPLFLEQKKGESEEQALKRSGFEDVAMVVAAMQEQDEDLVDAIRELRQEKGNGKVFNPRRLSERLEVVGPSISLEHLRSAVAIAVVERLGTNWDEMYGQLKTFSEQNGHCRVTSWDKRLEISRLGVWVANQRSNRWKLMESRRQELERLEGWLWSVHEDAWIKGFRQLCAFESERGHSRVPPEFVTESGYPLGRWVTKTRRKKARLSKERVAQLERVSGWTWEPRDTAWDQAFSRLQKHAETCGNCEVPSSLKTTSGVCLRSWIVTQRVFRTKGKLSPERERMLESLPGWTWDPNAESWSEGFNQLITFYSANGHCRVPIGHVTNGGFKLGQWVRKQRQKQDSISDERRRRLESLTGWTWDPVREAWDAAITRLTEFVDQHGHARVPDGYKTKDGFSLGKWVVNQRQAKDDLPPERIKELESFKGWAWRAHDASWEQGFAELVKYEQRTGHCSVPVKVVSPSGFKLGVWAFRQRQTKATMPEDRRNRLEQLKGWVWTMKEERGKRLA